jgi:hypothetical protein
MLLALREEPVLNTWVAGRDLRSVAGSERRRLAGYAAKGAFTERGTIARAVRYRRPDLDPNETGEALARVELASRVARLPKGEHTMLRRGGEPLTTSDRAKLQIARATLGDPPLLLLNHIDFDLGPEGREVLADVLRSYPGVAIIASDHPEELVPAYLIWDLRYGIAQLRHRAAKASRNVPVRLQPLTARRCQRRAVAPGRRFPMVQPLNCCRRRRCCRGLLGAPGHPRVLAVTGPAPPGWAVR